jgi:hypothetical protein
MEIKLLWALTLYAFITVVFSMMTLLITNRYQNIALETTLP